MLAKIHLKTACGCERSFYERVDHMPWQIRVPIRATEIPWVDGRITPTEVHSIRDFHIVDRRQRSARSNSGIRRQSMLRKYLGGGVLLALGAILLLQSQTYNSLPTATLSIVVEVVAIALLYSVWREL